MIMGTDEDEDVRKSAKEGAHSVRGKGCRSEPSQAYSTLSRFWPTDCLTASTCTRQAGGNGVSARHQHGHDLSLLLPCADACCACSAGGCMHYWPEASWDEISYQTS